MADGASAVFGTRELIHPLVSDSATAGSFIRDSSCYHHADLRGYGSPTDIASTYGLSVTNELQKGR